MGSFTALAVEFALIIAVAAVCGGVLGWLLGRRREPAAALTPSRTPAVERPAHDRAHNPGPDASSGDGAEEADNQPTQRIAAIVDDAPVTEPAPLAASGTADAPHDAPGAEPALDPGVAARLAELEQLVAAKDREISMLEAGAVTAWDKTVPTLEWQIDSLREENSEMAAMLRKALDELESQSVQAEALRSALSERDRRLAGLDTRSAS